MSAWLIILIVFVLILDVLVIVRIVIEKEWYKPMDKIERVIFVITFPFWGAFNVSRELKNIDQEFMSIIQSEKASLKKYKKKKRSSRQSKSSYKGSRSSSSSSSYNNNNTSSIAYYDDCGSGGE